MNRLTTYIAALSLAFAATPAHAISLTDLFAGGTIQVGDRLFADWEELKNVDCPTTGCVAGGVDTSLINVTGVGDGTAGNAYGLQFTADPDLGATGDEFVSLWFRYSVAVFDPGQYVSGSSLALTSISQTGVANLIVVEKDIYEFDTSDHLGFMEVYADPKDSPSLLSSNSMSISPQKKVWVEDSIFVDGLGGSAALDGFTQRFEAVTANIDIEKATNGVDADDPSAGDAPAIAVGGLVNWTYLVTNTGDVALTNVTVVDDQGVAVSCPQDSLDPMESMICTASGLADDLSTTGFTTVPGLCGSAPATPLYENIGTAKGAYLDLEVEDSDPSHYCNAATNTAPVAVDNNYSGPEDTQLDGNVITDDTSEGVDSDADGDGMTISSSTDVSHGTLVLGPDGSFSYDPNLNYCGPDSFTYVLTDDPPATPPAMTSNTATVSITVTCVNDPPVVSSVVASAQTSDYSDFIGTVVITVEDLDDTSTTLLESGEPPLSATGLSLASTGCTMKTTESPDEDGSTCTWDYTGQVVDPGNNVHDIVFTSADADGDGGTGMHKLTIQPEDATVTLDSGNVVVVEVVTAGGDSGEFKLWFSAIETSDPDYPHDGTAQFGNLNEMVPFMTLVPVWPGGPVSADRCDFIPSLPVYPAEGYSQVAMFECSFSDVPVDTYEILAEVDGTSDINLYFSGSDEGVFVVHDPSLGFASGGGWFYWPETETDSSDCGPEGYPGDRTNFGFEMKYNKERNRLQGSLLMIRQTVNEDCLDDGSYRVKSHSLNSMSAGYAATAEMPYGWASLAGKALYGEPGQDYAGGNSVNLYVEDHGEQGCNQDPADEFWIQVSNRDGIVLLQTNDSAPPIINPPNGPPRRMSTVTIECGDIAVPQEAGARGEGKR